jgi:hypothetical protein
MEPSKKNDCGVYMDRRSVVMGDGALSCAVEVACTADGFRMATNYSTNLCGRASPITDECTPYPTYVDALKAGYEELREEFTEKKRRAGNWGLQSASVKRDLDRFLRYLSDAVRGLNQTELF